MTLPASDWLRIDAVLDNEAFRELGDYQIAGLTLSIRHTGRAQLHH
ncbi:hypothetical protein ACIBI3_21500 [Actinomadura luteofluorescens]